MKKREFETLGKKLLPHLPGFVVSGALMAQQPVAPVLRAICFDSSRFSKEEFYIFVFFIPLYVETKHLYFNHGSRIDRPVGWRSDQPNLTSELLDAIEDELTAVCAVASARAVAESIATRTRGSPSALARRDLGYSWARAGEYDLAAKALEPLLDHRTSEFEWLRSLVAQVDQFLSGLSDPVATQQQLDRWQKSSVTNLGLAKFVGE